MTTLNTDNAGIGTTINSENEMPAICRTHPTWALFLVSVLGLFLELMLIRWIGTEVRIFAYLQNAVLVVCFLGLGLGCFTFRRPVAIRDLLIPLFLLVLLLAIPFTSRALGEISSMLSVLQDFEIWKKTVVDNTFQALFLVVLGLVLSFLFMTLIVETFIPIGRLMGRLLNDHPRTIRAYSVNVFGSLIGIWCFVLLSMLYQPPLTWMAVVALLLVPFIWLAPRRRAVNSALVLGLVGLSWFASREDGALEVTWSPYQKLALHKLRTSPPEQYEILVNNTGYQAMFDLHPRTVEAHEDFFPEELRGFSQYDIPFLMHPKPGKVLLVGAGSGNDAAGALRNPQVEHVTAVDIDPAILAMGQRHHPEKPYASDRVTLVNDDARSFFATCRERYDVIVFGLLDAHTTTAMTNARLDHYVYTRESIEHAKSLLAPDGILVMAFQVTRIYIGDRLARTLEVTFGSKPLWFVVPPSNYGWGAVMFVAGALDRVEEQIAANGRLATLITEWQEPYDGMLSYTTRIATDDWPYIYLERPAVPLLYFLLMGLLVLLWVRSRRRLSVPSLVGRWGAGDWHFFFLGAAFLLLEVQNISKASVALGNTWWVNAVIISGVLIMVLLANALAGKFPNLPLPLVYVCLCATCLTLYFVDISRFAFLPFATKACVVGGMTTLPMFFSGIIFIRSFAGAESKGRALGANLFGSLVGGLLQSVTFVAGIKALLLIVTGLYILALLTRPTPRRQRRFQRARSPQSFARPHEVSYVQAQRAQRGGPSPAAHP